MDASPSPISSVTRITHFALVFVLFPALLSIAKPHGWIYSIMWLMTAWTYAVMRRKYDYRFFADWNYPAFTWAAVKPILIRFVPLAISLFLFTWFMIPDKLLSLPLQRPNIWVMVMIWYPVLSVVPQELIFRSFFFRHYAAWFERPFVGKLINAFAFGWLHIILQNWVAVIFSGLGGYLFADTYHKHKSLALVCFEHALYGCYVFTIGLGYYFYHGNAVK